ncbi:hypothetical protein SHKM778_54760 [Streptomyces sp. KM77-8]|uniref:Uncharacterized protein n=1 Tax=Streptomyces haneummycinicus TaxID=3074435 RepID=A0AAT9HP07_9ACTN
MEVEGAGGGLGVVLALQAVDLHRVVRRGGRGRADGGESGDSQRGGQQKRQSVSESSGAHGTSVGEEGVGSLLSTSFWLCVFCSVPSARRTRQYNVVKEQYVA